MGYNVYNNEELVNNTATAANYTVTELDYSTEYSFTVKAIGKNEGLSAASNIETVTTGF
jgi:chitodextrinase